MGSASPQSCLQQHFNMILSPSSEPINKLIGYCVRIHWYMANIMTYSDLVWSCGR
ncbi:hypothetical protein Scep_010667 [Stephania cephalantha]|uniref:Uncharacterized protein n=1 Tax=Stephania cephalantha TaxID=152367 RepID=A0AAP0JVU3_9MAGN